MKEMQFSTDIKADKQKVWDTFWQDATFRQWAGLIDPETYMKGELREGNEVQFISAANGYGVTSLVDTLKPAEYVQLRHSADTTDSGAGTRDDQWTGGTETYTLTQDGDTTTLTLTFDAPAELEQEFQITYPKALQKIKELAEW